MLNAEQMRQLPQCFKTIAERQRANNQWLTGILRSELHKSQRVSERDRRKRRALYWRTLLE